MSTQPERHGIAWTADEQKRLYDAFVAGTSVNAIATAHERSTGGIRSCLRQLGLIDQDNLTISPAPEFTATAAAQKRQLKAAAKKKFAAREDPVENLTPEMNERFREALRLMDETSEHLFITGKAGTGKSTLLSYFCRTTDKQPVVLAPTGVAALNVKGQTIHNFFNFYVDVTPEKIRNKNRKPRKAKIYKKLKTIIIDEVSMLRADLLDCIDTFLQMHGPKPHQPFGGVQMIFIGDLYQLPPVVSPQEKETFAERYETPYFFSAQVLNDAPIKIVDLQKIYRQKDQDFIDLLNKIRNNDVGNADLALINSRVAKTDDESGGFHITLTTTNAIADAINEKHLASLNGKSFTSNARVEGEFGREYFPTASDLQYKIGAQIMMLNNDTEKRWVNGSLGVIRDILEDPDGHEYLSVKLQDHRGTVEVYPHTWETYSFEIEDNTIMPEPIGTFTQYPFRLAWAITIHKSQGKTFDRVVIDIGRGAFAAGQIYVALSRCTSFEGVTLRTPLRAQDIRTDGRVLDFFAGNSGPTAVDAALDTMAFIRKAIAENTALDITYLKADNTETSRKVIPLKAGRATHNGEAYDGMKAFCTVEEREHMFRVDRILKIQQTKR